LNLIRPLWLVATGLLIGAAYFVISSSSSDVQQDASATPEFQEASIVTVQLPVLCRIADRLRAGESLYDLLLRNEVDSRTVVEVGAALSELIPPKNLWPGDRFVMYFDEEHTLQEVDIRRNPMEVYRLTYGSNEYSAVRVDVPVDTVYRTVWGHLKSNLWNAFVDAGAPPEMIVAFTEIFAWSIDFFREVQPGDAFGARFAELQVNGKTVETAPLDAAFYVRGNDTLWAFGFAEDGRLKYYDRDGNSLQKALLRAPLKYSRVSSKFSKRRFHPTAKVYRPHYGTDYAAAAGTPIYAAGDGQVRYAGWKNGLGKCVEIRHPNGYVTIYGHMMKLAKGIHAGESVRQRDVIGYVGMTGNASGHHLHYEVRQGRKPINPQTLKLPAKGPVADALRSKFERHRDSLWQLLVPVYGPPLASVM